ncbi:MAG: flavodoxin-dependent (E)-4-hydroxy-3-methylbut-2-enyl-diphosphate synthase [Kiritimatiellia bacterium]
MLAGKKAGVETSPVRRVTKQIRIGSVAIGGGAPISVQTMVKTSTEDIDAVLAQIHSVSLLGCDIVRIAVPDADTARLLYEIKKEAELPLVADIHFDHRLALMALEAGVDGLRINPGNIGAREKIAEVVKAAEERRVPIRIGVNAGSLERDLLNKYGGATAEALVESALRHVAIIEELGYHEIKLSVKASDVKRTVEAYRLLSQRTDYPLHLGLTEAGTLVPGAVRSAVALGILLSEGIGDTIRVSLTSSPENEVRVGLDILRGLGLKPPGQSVISCPKCGRAEVNVERIAEEIEQALEDLYCDEPKMRRPVVAVMGCMVNGPGEAREADVALVGGKDKFALYRKGILQRTVPESEAAGALIAEVRKWAKG